MLYNVALRYVILCFLCCSPPCFLCCSRHIIWCFLCCSSAIRHLKFPELGSSCVTSSRSLQSPQDDNGCLSLILSHRTMSSNSSHKWIFVNTFCSIIVAIIEDCLTLGTTLTTVVIRVWPRLHLSQALLALVQTQRRLGLTTGLMQFGSALSKVNYIKREKIDFYV